MNASAPRSRPKRILLVTGMSGAGKSTALDTFEDMGWEVVDNLPLTLIERLLGSPLPQGATDEGRPLALGIDSRTRGFDGEGVVRRLRRLHDQGALDIEVLFLECAGTELIRRFSETRRRHPLAIDRPAADGIAEERALLAPLRRAADHLIDTTDSSRNALQSELRARFGGEEGRDAAMPTLSVTSFGFARGVPRNADLVFDMRFLRNPHWEEALRPLTGLDAAVGEYVSDDPAYREALDRIEGLLALLLPRYAAEGKSYVTVAFGCTGGRHRSVHCAEEIARRLRGASFSPRVSHRDLAPADRAPDALPEPDEGGRRSGG